MIHQFAELGAFYRDREGLGKGADDAVAQYMRDPVAKFRTKTVLLLIFSDKGFERIQVEECDASKRRAYLYREGPPNGWDATPTSGLRAVKGNIEKEYHAALLGEVRKKLVRLSNSIRDAVERGADLAKPETEALGKMRAWLNSATGKDTLSLAKCVAMRDQVHRCNPPVQKKKTIVSLPAIISVAWQDGNKTLKRVGDFGAFQQSLVRSGSESASTKKGIKGAVQGIGQCSICGKSNTKVHGLLKVFHPPLYTLDKPGSVSGGFDSSVAWRNFPACEECRDNVDFAVERVKKELRFNYYSGLKYLLLPSPVQPAETRAYEFLDRLVAARLSQSAKARLTAAEDELFYVISQERNLLQVDLVFYEPNAQYFRPALYVSGLLPTRFRKLFDAKDVVDRHPWLNEPSPVSFSQEQFTFGSFRNAFPAAHGGSTFNDDFLATTRAALELRPFSTRRLLQVGMRWVQDDCQSRRVRIVDKKRVPEWQYRLADLFRTIQFFETLTDPNTERRQEDMQVDYGDSEQAKRVRKVLDQTSGKLRDVPAAQASFLVGGCCSRIEVIQQRHYRDRSGGGSDRAGGAAPFSGKLKGFRLNQRDVQGLFVAAKEKAKAYGDEHEGKVSGLLECAAAALAATPEQWPLSPDEISYFFALGHALRPRFAKDADETQTSQPQGKENQAS
jgi:CRISPR-associated protein Csh1